MSMGALAHATGHFDASLFMMFGIACLLVLTWLIPEARRNGNNPWPWVALTVFLGSFGPLLYLAFCRADAPARDRAPSRRTRLRTRRPAASLASPSPPPTLQLPSSPRNQRPPAPRPRAGGAEVPVDEEARQGDAVDRCGRLRVRPLRLRLL